MCLAGDKVWDPRVAPLGEVGAPFRRGGSPRPLHGPLFALSPCGCHVVAKLGASSLSTEAELFLSLKVEARPGREPLPRLGPEQCRPPVLPPPLLAPCTGDPRVPAVAGSGAAVTCRRLRFLGGPSVTRPRACDVLGNHRTHGSS